MYNNPCGCNDNPCNEPTPCDCAVKDLNTKCLIYSGATLACTGIEQGANFDEFLLALDEYICTAISQLQSSINLINVGEGAEVYAGNDNLGRRKLRSILGKGNLIDIVENENDITISINEANLNTFIEANQKTYTALNVGTGATLFKNLTTVGDVNTFNFKSVILDSQSGTGQSFIRDVQQNTNDVTIRHKKINSNTLTITSTDTEVLINTPSTSTIPALYVNNLYVPTEAEFLAGNTKGNGTLGKPFTDTVTAYVAGVPTIIPNTAIQNALDVFIGTGTALLPQLVGQKIIVQDNNGSYTFTGNLNISNLYLVLEEDMNSTTTGYLVDMDDATKFNATSSVFTIEIKEGKTLQIQGLGFRNSGNASTTPPSYDSGRVGIFLGEGEIYSIYNGADVLTRYIFTGEGNNNDDGLHFQVKCKVRATNQGIYYTKNRMRIDFYNQITSGIFLGSINIATKAFHMTGGGVRFYEKGAIAISSETSGRTYGVTFDPASDTIGECNFQLNSARVTGTSRWCFAKLSAGDVRFLGFNSPSGDEFSTRIPGTNLVVDGLFENLDVSLWGIDFRNNVFSLTGIDQTKVDLNIGKNVSVINFIGNSVVENLVSYPSKESARITLPKNSAFLLERDVNASDLVAGVEYKIKTSGSPSLGTVGSYIISDGTESGTGVATLIERCVVI